MSGGIDIKSNGFSLVELLIALAVVTCLISTITPAALNAVKKAKAEQVAKSLKVLVNQFENIVLLGDDPPNTLRELTRDIPSDYGVMYSGSGDNCSVVAYYTGDVDYTELNKLLKAACSELIELDSPTVLAGSCDKDGNVTVSYGTIVGGKPLGIGKLEIVALDRGIPEIVYIRNTGSGDIDIHYWKLKKRFSIDTTTSKTLNSLILKPGEEIRVYSRIDSDSIPKTPYDIFWRSDEVWKIDSYRKAYLYSPGEAELVSVFSY